MEPDEIKKQVGEFTGLLKQKVEPMHEAVAAEAAAPEVAAPVPEAGKPCINKGFKELVKVLNPDYIGQNVKDFVLEFFEQIPECQEVAA